MPKRLLTKKRISRKTLKSKSKSKSKTHKKNKKNSSSRKQKGGVAAIDWGRLRDNTELNLNDVLVEYLVDQNKLEQGPLRHPTLFYKVDQQLLNGLKRIIEQNIQLNNLTLQNAVLVIPDLTGMTDDDDANNFAYEEIYLRSPKKKTKQMLDALFSFKSNDKTRNLNLNLELDLDLIDTTENENLFDTDVLTKMFLPSRGNRNCIITQLNLKGWQFCAAGLYILAILEILGRIESVTISESVITGGLPNKPQIMINYMMIKNKFKDSLKKIFQSTAASLGRHQGTRGISLLTPSIVGLELRFENSIRIDDIFSLFSNISDKIMIIIRLLLAKYYGGGHYVQEDNTPDNNANLIPLEIISILLMDRNNEEEKLNFNRLLFEFTSYMMKIKLMHKYNLTLAYLSESQKGLISNFVTNLKNSQGEVYDFTCQLRLEPLHQLMVDSNLPTLQILFPDITQEDIYKYNNATDRVDDSVDKYFYTI